MNGRPAGKERALYPDVLRGFAIFMMLLGHCLQMGSGAEFRVRALYFSDRFYQWIYSFHMPLFMLLSGALFAFSLKRHQEENASSLLGNRFRRLILPVLVWSVIELAAAYFKAPDAFIPGAEAFLAEDFPGVSGAAAAVLYCIVHFLTSHWFLWAVFLSEVLVLAVRRVGDSPLIHAALLAAAFFVPDGLNAMMYKFMHPFFLLGYYGVIRASDGDPRSAEERIPLPEAYEKHKAVFLAGFAAVFFLLFHFFTRDAFIYVSGYKLIGKASPVRQLGTDFYRLFIGIAGCAVMLILWDMLLKRGGKPSVPVRVLAAAGRCSLGIYLLSQYVITLLLVPAADRLFRGTSSPAARYLCAFAEAAAVLALCYAFTRLLRKTAVTRVLIGEVGRVQARNSVAD